MSDLTAEEFVRNKIRKQRQIKGEMRALWTYKVSGEDALRWAHEFALLKANGVETSASGLHLQRVNGWLSAYDKILDKAIEKWGIDAQLEMVIEECLELALALQKLKRLRGDMTQKERNAIDEIADVKIMIKQAEKIFGSETVNERVDFKMNRLNERLSEGVI